MAVRGVGGSNNTPVPINRSHGQTKALTVKPRANVRRTQQPNAHQVKIDKTAPVRPQGVGARLDIKA
jgi:hypothetical protein